MNVGHGDIMVRKSDSLLSESGFKSSRYHFEAWATSFTPRCSSSLSCINEYLAVVVM